MAKDKSLHHISNLEELRKLRIAELDIDYRKQLHALKMMLKNGRIKLNNHHRND